MTIEDVFEKYPKLSEKEQRVSGIYGYVAKVNDQFYLKIGKAINETIYDRNSKITGIVHIVDSTIFIWDGNDDTIAHKMIKKIKPGCWAGDKHTETGTEEAFKFNSLEELESIKIICDCVYKKEASTGKKLEIYQDIKDCVETIYNNKCSQVGLLTYRWGKTNNIILLSKAFYDRDGIQIHILVSYVGTVETSYKDTIIKDAYGEGYDNIAYIQADGQNKNLAQEVDDAINSGKQIFYYLQLTGDDKVFTERFKPIEKYVDKKNTILYIEEADFGAHTKNQVDKIKQIKHKYLYILSGTGEEKLRKLAKDFNVKTWVKRDYVVDLLGTPYEDRKKDVAGVDWCIFNNSGLFKYDSELKPEQAECWSEMFNNFDKYKMYFRKLIKSLICPEDIMSLDEKAQVFLSDILQKDCVTEIFVSGNKSGHKKLKEEIERLNNCAALVIDGDVTTNREAESLTKIFIKANKGKRLFVISSLMGTRSYSIKEIKNVILMLDCSSQDMVSQRVARGLTAWGGRRCKVLDMRLTEDSGNLSKWIAPSCVQLKRSGRTIGEIIEWFAACDKLNFYSYFNCLSDTFSEPLTGSDFEKAMYSEDLRLLIAEDLDPDSIQYNLTVIANLDIDDTLRNDNIKGEKSKAKRNNSNSNDSGSELDENNNDENNEDDDKEIISSKRQHAIFLLNGKRFFYNDADFKDHIVENTIKSYINNERIYDDFKCILNIDLKFLIEVIKKYEQEFKKPFDNIIGDTRAIRLSNVDEQLAIKLWSDQESLWNLIFKDIKFKDGENVLVAFWANYYFVNRLRKEHPKVNFYQMEETLLDADYITGKLCTRNISDFVNIIKDMNFDKIIMNPPYNGHLHLDILREAMKYSKEVVNLSPANQMFAGMRLVKDHSVIKKHPELVKHIQDVYLVNPEEASRLFNAAFAGPLMIIHYDLTKEGKDYKDFNIIPKNLRSIFDKTVRAVYEGKYESLQSIIKEGECLKSKLSLTCPEVHGHQGQSDWAEITSKNYEKALASKQRWGWHLEFDTEEERRNCWECWHLKSHMFIHSLVKADNFNMYQWLPALDYSKKWTDEMLYNFFGLTDEEKNIIEKEIK